MKKLVLIMLCSSLLLVSGCWDLMIIEDLSLAFAMGIDQAEDPEMFRLTLTSPNFSKSSVTETTKYVAEGYSIANTLYNMQGSTDRLLVLGQVATLVFSEEAARNGLMHKTMQDVDQQRDMNPNAHIVVVQGASAQDVLYLKPPEEARVANYLTNLLEANFNSGRIPRITASRYWFSHSSPGVSPVIPMISITGQSKDNMGFRISGLAAIDDEGKMQGAYTAHEGILCMLLTGNNRRTRFTTQLDIKGGHRETSFLVKKANPKVRTAIEADKARVAINLALDVDIIDIEMPLDALNPQVIEEIGQALALDLQGNMLDMLSKGQSWGTDTFGLGQFVRIQHPKWFKTKDWSDELRNSHITIEVKVNLRTIGNLTNPQY